MIPACDQRLASGEMTRAMRPMTEPTLDLIVQRAMLSNDVAYEVLPCDPDVADAAAFCAHYGFAIEQAGNTILVASKKVSELLAVKRLSFADEETPMDLTGMMIGGVTAFGIGDLPIYVDSAVMEQARVV